MAMTSHNMLCDTGKKTGFWLGASAVRRMCPGQRGKIVLPVDV